MNTINTDSVTFTPIANSCGHKLPCGVCRLMMCICPINGTPVVTPSWTFCNGPDNEVLTSETKTAVGDMRGET